MPSCILNDALDNVHIGLSYAFLNVEGNFSRSGAGADGRAERNAHPAGHELGQLRVTGASEELDAYETLRHGVEAALKRVLDRIGCVGLRRNGASVAVEVAADS